MDQVKKILGILMVQRFWILCGMITLIPVGGWFSATSGMRAITDARKSAIKQKTDAAKTLLGKQSHPNDESHKFMDALRVKVTNEVGAAWEQQYDRQKELLVWPTELGAIFIGKVDPLRPLEKVKPPVTANDESLNLSLRELYRDYIFAELPKLAKKIDAQWVVQEAAEGGADISSGSSGSATPYTSGTGASNSATKVPAIIEKVVWDQQDQAALRARYDWRGTKDKAPRTIDVLYVQEDLWIMSALMGIIANTNQGSTARYNAVIKQINYINIGRDVGGSTGGVMRISGGNSMSGEGMGGMEGGMSGMSSAGAGMSAAGAMSAAAGGASSGMASSMGMAAGGESGGSGSSGMGMGAGRMMDPAEFRYVDLNYKPVTADTLRTAITADTRDPTNAFLVVAKRIPIRLGLTVDQRKLNRFISECGNAPLMVEVRQVRFNRQGGSTSGSSGGMGGMGMSGDSGMGGMGMSGSSSLGMSGMGSGSMGMSGMGSSGFGGRSGSESSGSSGYGGMTGDGMGSPYGGAAAAGALPPDVSPHDKPVEIYGVVYLYNPVDLKKLGIEKKEVDPTAPADAAPATGAATPSPPANPVPAGAAAPVTK